MSDLQQAQICHYNADRGFGFLARGSGKTYEKFFFHISQFKSESAPQIGQLVTFEISSIIDGPRPAALNVTPVGAV